MKKLSKGIPSESQDQFSPGTHPPSFNSTYKSGLLIATSAFPRGGRDSAWLTDMIFNESKSAESQNSKVNCLGLHGKLLGT